MANLKLNSFVLNQGNYDILPFSFEREKGFDGVSSRLDFKIEMLSNEYLDYNGILKRDNASVLRNAKEQDFYVPSELEAKYVHNNKVKADIIGKDTSGIKKIKYSSFPDDTNDFEQIDESYKFIVPKFTWSIDADENLPDIEKYMFIGTFDHKLNRINYDNESASSVSIEDLENPVYKIVFGDGNDKIYVSTPYYLYRYVYAHKKDIYEFDMELKKMNPQRIIVGLNQGQYLWGFSSYSNSVFKIDMDTFDIIEQFEDIDAPFKIKYSKHHDCIFVAGYHNLWKIKDNNCEVVYKISDYKLSDIDISENGEICMVLEGLEESYMRILERDLYGILLNEKASPYVFRFCAYTKEGKFYAISELNISTDDTSYASKHYIYDIKTKKLQVIDSDQALMETTTTTTLAVPTKAVELTSPVGGEYFKRGSSYDIQWISSKAISDLVKIELYRGGKWFANIAEETGNTGVFRWDVPDNIEESGIYSIKITWISASSDPDNYDVSGNITIAEDVPDTTTTTTTARITEEVVAIEYDNLTNQVVILLKSGFFMIFDFDNMGLYGMNNSGVLSPFCIGIKNTYVSQLDRQKKIRVFVGSQKHLSDKWDSGIIETPLSSILYGGGNNLVPGNKYYVHVQLYSDRLGWGDVQISEFEMPR